MELREEILDLARRAARAAEIVGELDTSTKNAWLLRSAELLEQAKGEILEANQLDMEQARAKDVADPLVNRLSIAAGKWDDMIQGLRDVAALPDPIGEITDSRLRPNGLRVSRMRIPLGVIAMIYESRPNVTVDAAALCLKAGNAVVLRGGSEAFHTNQALGRVLRAAGLPADIEAQPDRRVPVTAVNEALERAAQLQLRQSQAGAARAGGPGLRLVEQPGAGQGLVFGVGAVLRSGEGEGAGEQPGQDQQQGGAGRGHLSLGSGS